MATPKKPKRDSRIVMYIRVKPEERAQAAKIAAQRGYPHTIASVSAEMFSRGLASEAARDREASRAPSNEITETSK